MFYVALYLIAVVTANLVIAVFGAGASIVDAFVLIALDLTARDKLHDAWHHSNLVPKMTALIATGSILSYLLNKDAGQIAFASFVAFALANIADTLVYALLGNRARLVRVNGSNLVSAAVDSIVFPTLAFGGIMLWVTVGQFVAKFVGGFFWSLILNRKELRRVTLA